MRYARFGMVACAGLLWAAAWAGDGNWKLGKYTTRTGDVVTVDIPAGKPDSGSATCLYDFPRLDGKVFRASIRARGFGVSRPEPSYLGFKFMATYRDDASGALNYPGAAQVGDDFPWQTVSFTDGNVGVKRAPGTFTLGLQAATGRVEFDLSSFKVEVLPPLWPETNATHRCVYTPRVKDAPARRGVMLGHGLTEEDFKVLHRWGVTLARFQMTRHWNTVGGNRDLADFDRYIDGELDLLEKHLAWAKKYGIQIVVDLHAAPGARDERKDLYMCHDATYAEAFVATWRKIATRFRGRPEIFGFDLVNEPQQLAPALPGCDYWSIQSRAAEAIRAIDPETPVIVESNCYDGPATFSYLKPLALTNVIYQVHMYVPHAFTHQGVGGPAPKWTRAKYPDAAKGWNRDFLRRTLKPVRDFQKRHGARIYVGEFSAIAWAEGAADYLRDCIDLFEEEGWDWTYHAFREWTGWSVEHEAEKPRAQRPSFDNPRRRALLDGFRRGRPTAIRGPFPLLCTPWTAEGTLDCAVLAKEAAFVGAGGAAGVVWPTAGEVADLVREGEYVKGLDALAARAAQPDFTACLTAICPGPTSASALARVREANAAFARHGVKKAAILARPPDDAKTQGDIEAHYRALARIAKGPVIIQTYNGKSPQPDVTLLVQLAKDYPEVYGYVKEESPGSAVNARIAQLVAAKPVIRTVFSGWGAKGWLYQGRALGTEGMITQRPAYADLLARMWAEEQRGDPDGALAGLYAKYLLMVNLGENFGGSDDQMRGPHLYVLQRRGVFTNTYTRRRPPKGDTGGRKWIVDEVRLSPAEKAEIDRRLAFCGLLP